MLTREQSRAAARLVVEQHRRLAGLSEPRVHEPVLPPLPVALPREDWPTWAKAVALLSRAEDRGVGDTVARVIGPHTSAAFKAWHLATFNKPCGCARRQAEWNAKFPYPQNCTDVKNI